MMYQTIYIYILQNTFIHYNLYAHKSNIKRRGYCEIPRSPQIPTLIPAMCSLVTGFKM